MSTPTSKRPSPNCESTSTAPGPPTWESPSIRSPPACRLLVGGEEVSKYKEGDDQYVVRLRLDEPFRNNPAGMEPVAGPLVARKERCRVSDVAALRLEPGPASIDRYNRQRQISLFANLDNLPLGEAITAAQAKIDELNMKPATRRCSARAPGRSARRPTIS